MKLVAVFGGGGAKALAHAGAWKAIQERGHEIVHIVGTSMGAVVGAAFAAGTSYERFVDTARAIRSKDVAALDLLALLKGVFAPALFKPAPLRRTIARLVPATRFADLKSP
ncbi:MAG TPA: patatin-like phospholipase family protein, partial [Gemmatimonadales bacterium]|nr:patatin-like phospholipase family protein [Gemmatimonadales bacterium]